MRVIGCLILIPNESQSRYFSEWGPGSRHPLLSQHLTPLRRSSSLRFHSPTMPWQASALNDALNAAGHTPLIRLDRIAKDASRKCNLCTLVNLPGSSFLGILCSLSSASGKSRVHVLWRIREGQHCQADGPSCRGGG